MYQLVQYPTKISQQYYRYDLLAVIGSLGGIIFLLLKGSKKLVVGSNDFALSKDMMQRLYTMDKKPPTDDVGSSVKEKKPL